jgi:hypothetical protein
VLADLAENFLFTTGKLITSLHLTLTSEHENFQDVERRKEK